MTWEELACEPVWAPDTTVEKLDAAAALGCPTPISADDTTVMRASRKAAAA